MGNYDELKKENEMLKEENEKLKILLGSRSCSGNSNAYASIRAMIIQKVANEITVPDYLIDWQKKDMKRNAERQIMRDLKWELRVRTINDFKYENIAQAEEFLKNYEIPEMYKHSPFERKVENE